MKKKIIMFNIYFICLIMVLQFNSLWFYLKPFSSIIKYGIIAELCILSFSIIVQKKEISKLIRYLYILLILTFPLIVLSSHSYYKLVCDFIFVSLFVYYCFTIKCNVLKCISDVIIVLAFISIMFYIIFSVLKLSNANYLYEPFQNGVIYQSYHNMYYTSQRMSLYGLILQRNGFIYSEPGSFALYLDVGFIYETLIRKKTSIFRILILILAVITTTSAFGIFIITLYSIILILFKFNKLNSMIKGFYFIFVPIIVVFSAFLIYQLYVYKFQINNISATVRNDDIRIGITLFKYKPLWGWGYSNWSPQLSMQSAIVRGADIGGHSNGIVNVLYSGGIYLFILYLVGICGYVCNTCKNKIQKILLILFLVGQLYVFPCETSYIYYLILSVGYFSFFNDSKFYIKNFVAENRE